MSETPKDIRRVLLCAWENGDDAPLAAAAKAEIERLRARVAELEEAVRECLQAATDGRYLGGAGARAGCAIVETCARAALAKGSQ